MLALRVVTVLYVSHPRHADELNSPSQHHQLLHSPQHGHVIVWEKSSLNDGKGNWHKIDQVQGADQVNNFLVGLKGNKDTYFTVNEFIGWRLTRLLKSLRATYVDLDFGAPPTRYDLDIALEILHTKQMPPPNVVVFSGRGLHLYWIIDPIPAKALPVWQAVENALVKSLEEFHADMVVKDCTRVLRMVGTVNSKNGEMVRGLVLDPKPWAFHDLTNEVLGHIAPSKNHKAKINSLAAAQVRKGMELKRILNKDGIESAIAEQLLDMDDDTLTEEAKKEIIREQLKRAKQPNMSFFAFTATPKFKTLAVFNEAGENGQAPFHHYSMRQAIEEKFILDVLAHYTTYKRYYKLIQKVEDNDPSVPRRKAAKALARFVQLHDYKCEIQLSRCGWLPPPPHRLIVRHESWQNP